MIEEQNQVEDNKEGGIDVAIKAQQDTLDDLVSANSIFTVAVFIGLSVVNPGDINLLGDKKCNVEPNMYNKLIVNEVLSFAFYLLSSLVAKALKTHLYTYSLEGTEIEGTEIKRLCSRFIRGSMFTLSALGSILGASFLSLSMVELIEIRLGKMSCRNSYTYTYTLHASGALIALVVIALSIYFVCMMHAIYSSVKLEKGNPN